MTNGKTFSLQMWQKILIGLILGIVAGFVVGEHAKLLKPIGDIFITLIRMVVMPVIFVSLVCGVTAMKDLRKMGRVAGKTLLLYGVTMALAGTMSMLLAGAFGIGHGLNYVVSGVEQAATHPSMLETLMRIFPANPFKAFADGDVLPIIFFAVLFGLAIAYVKDSKDAAVAKGADTLFNVVNAAAETMYKIVRGIMEYAPIGVFFLIAMVFAQQGAKALGPLLFVTLTVYVGLLVHLVISYGGIMAVAGLGFGKFLKGANEAMITAFVTRSSNGTLPVTMRVSEEKLGIPRSICGLAGFAHKVRRPRKPSAA